MTKLEKKDRPTNRDLQDQIDEVHGCLENVGKQVTTQGQQLVAIADAMGVRLPTESELERGDPVKKLGRRVGGLPTWQAAGGAAAVITLAMGAYKIVEPAFVAFGLALHHALMGH